MQDFIEDNKNRAEINNKKKQLRDSIKKHKSKSTKVASPNKDFAAGKTLPKKLQECFPENLVGKPIEEIDDFYKSHYVLS